MGSIVSMNASANFSGLSWTVSVSADITWDPPSEGLNPALAPRAQSKDSGNGNVGSSFQLNFQSVVSNTPLVHRYTGATMTSVKPDHVDAVAYFATTTYSEDTASDSC